MTRTLPNATTPWPLPQVSRHLVGIVETLAFWLAVVLPWLAAPLLVDGIARTESMLLAGIVMLDVLALVVGRCHASETAA